MSILLTDKFELNLQTCDWTFWTDVLTHVLGMGRNAPPDVFPVPEHHNPVPHSHTEQWGRRHLAVLPAAGAESALHALVVALPGQSDGAACAVPGLRAPSRYVSSYALWQAQRLGEGGRERVAHEAEWFLKGSWRFTVSPTNSAVGCRAVKRTLAHHL